MVAADYECVYSGILLKSDDLETLTACSMICRVRWDFKAHSMSVSDVVVMNRNHELRRIMWINLDLQNFRLLHWKGSRAGNRSADREGQSLG